MTPYFETEELVDNFHKYVYNNSADLTDTSPEKFKNNKFDLRRTLLFEINDLAKIFTKDIKNQVVIYPVAETMREFYGIDQGHIIGYVDPTKYEWENDEEEESGDVCNYCGAECEFVIRDFFCSFECYESCETIKHKPKRHVCYYCGNKKCHGYQDFYCSIECFSELEEHRLS
jgi:hypothetical protein